MNEERSHPLPSPDRWARVYADAAAAARRSGARGVLRVDRLDGLALARFVARSQPVVFARADAWAGEDGPRWLAQSGALPVGNRAALSLAQYWASLQDGACRGTGGFPLSDLLRAATPLPSALAQRAAAGPNVFGAAAGARTPWHRDAGDGLNLHLLGRKRWRLLSPAWATTLGCRPAHAGAGYEVCACEPDGLRGCEPVEVVVQAGESILVPCGWLHEVSAVTPALSIALPLHMT